MKVNAVTNVPVTQFTAEQIELIKRTVCKGASNDELALFLYQAHRTQLDPLSRQIYAVRRWDPEQGREVMQIQTAIDGFRLQAERTGKYIGQLGPFWCGPDGEWVDAWTAPEPPAAARVMVLRRDFKEPITGIARYGSFVQRRKDGTPMRMWRTMPDVMLAKCAESQALRRAFPQELSALYIAEEMGEAESGEQIPAAAAAPAIPRTPPPPADNVMLASAEAAANDNGQKGDHEAAEVTLTDRLAAADALLEEAAQSGTAALREAWDRIAADLRPALKGALDRRHKVVAQAVDRAPDPDAA